MDDVGGGPGVGGDALATALCSRGSSRLAQSGCTRGVNMGLGVAACAGGSMRCDEEDGGLEVMRVPQEARAVELRCWANG
jgi:hypothetical protein